MAREVIGPAIVFSFESVKLLLSPTVPSVMKVLPINGGVALRMRHFLHFISCNVRMLFDSLRYEVDLADNELAVTLHVNNPGDEPFDFQVPSKSRSIAKCQSW